MKTWRLISWIDSILNFLWLATIIFIPLFVVLQINSYSRGQYIEFKISVENLSRDYTKYEAMHSKSKFKVSMVPKSSKVVVATCEYGKYLLFYWIYEGMYNFVYLFILYFLRKLFGNFTNGDYFSYKNSLLLKYIAIIVASCSLLAQVRQFIGSKLVSEYLPAEAERVFKWNIGDGISYLFLGLVIYILADIFKQAAVVEVEKEQLQTENEGFI